MFEFYCNKCFRLRKFETNLLLFISQCGHILCKDCVHEKCCICSRPFKSTQINKDMPQTMADLFNSPLKHYQHYRKIMKFHHDQKRRLVEHMYNNNEEKRKKLHDERQGYIKLQGTIKRDLEQERERIRKLRDYIAYHERRLEQVRYITPPITAQPRPRYPPSRCQKMSHDVSATISYTMLEQFSKPLRPNVIYPQSPTISANNSSITTEGTERPKSAATKRTPPPLLPFPQHKMMNKQFSFGTID